METKQLIKTLVRSGSDPHVLYILQPFLGFTNEEWDEAIQEDMEREYYIQRMEENWRAKLPSAKEREDMFEKEGISREQMNLMKQRYIIETYEQLVRKENKTDEDYRKMKALKDEYRYHYEMKGISPDMLSQAKQYPIANVLKVNRGFACCPFHNEKTPSMCVYKNNTFHCFGCQANGDVIDLVKQIHNLDFRSAVKFLIGS